MGLGGALGCKARESWVCSWQHPQQCQRHLGNTGHRRLPGGLEASSEQLLDSEQNFRKLVHSVGPGDEVLGMG